jgi:5'-AMP-activated protein kinase regulatory gamma subunit
VTRPRISQIRRPRSKSHAPPPPPEPHMRSASGPSSSSPSSPKHVAEAAASHATSATAAHDFFPLATATLQTTVFDVVHLFSELGIGAVPIVDSQGVVINLYETVDVVELVRTNAYQVLDLTIEDALRRRSREFPGVTVCTAEDSLASILAYMREKRVHRMVIVEGEDEDGDSSNRSRPPVKGRLVGILSLSDILRHFVAEVNVKGVEIEGLGFRGEGRDYVPSKKEVELMTGMRLLDDVAALGFEEDEDESEMDEDETSEAGRR